MPIPLDSLVETIKPDKTVLLLGSGSSIPSGAPSVDQIRAHLINNFPIATDDLSLPDLATIIEIRHGRKKLIESIRELFTGLRPSGGLLQLPKHEWKSLYTTNYDNLIELSYQYSDKPIITRSSNFDFGTDEIPNAVKLMKLHGTIDKDVIDGNKSRITLTESDYDSAKQYRKFLFSSMEQDLIDADLIIIGQSLSDTDIRQLVTEAIELGKDEANIGMIYLIMYKQSVERAELLESKGLKVCYGSIDEFFELLKSKPLRGQISQTQSGNPIDASSNLYPITLDVASARKMKPRVGEMFNGSPASYADIESGNTFVRSVTHNVERLLLRDEHLGIVLIGAAGVGKSTAARQILLHMNEHGYIAWEHNSDHTFMWEEWLRVAKRLDGDSKKGIVFIDDCDIHLYEVNRLFDALKSDGLRSLYVLLASSPHRWNPRLKSPTLFLTSIVINMRQLNRQEVTNLLHLVNNREPIRELVATEFLHYAEEEQRRRLLQRCERDMFVCLKNIFATDKFDDILLREYATLNENYQEIYKFVAVLEDSGIRVHRQLIVRLLELSPTEISKTLDNLSGIIGEYTINDRIGIYGWKVRHSVIANIITKYKFAESGNFEKLYERVIDELNPSYDIEIRSLRELANSRNGIRRISDRRAQNKLLAKMISIAPGQRVPRHRLVRNLIDMKEFGNAEAEIRLFNKDFGEDGPMYRYSIVLALSRAKYVKGIMDEDRQAILLQAVDMAREGIKRFPLNKNMLYTYCEVALELYNRFGVVEVLEEALVKLREAQQLIGDPEIIRQISLYESRIA